MGYTLRDRGLKEILLAVDVGHDINTVAQEYVKVFNQSGKFRIVKWGVRNPEKDQIEEIRVFNRHAKFEWAKDHWESVYSDPNGATIRKHVFFIQLIKVDCAIGHTPQFDSSDPSAALLKENFKRNIKSNE